MQVMSMRRTSPTANSTGTLICGNRHVLDTSWQAKTPDAFDILQFNIDWEHKVAACPAGQHSAVWVEGRSQEQTPVIRVNFPMNVCMACPLQVRCTRGFNRGLTLRPQPEHQALQTPLQPET